MLRRFRGTQTYDDTYKPHCDVNQLILETTTSFLSFYKQHQDEVVAFVDQIISAFPLPPALIEPYYLVGMEQAPLPEDCSVPVVFPRDKYIYQKKLVTCTLTGKLGCQLWQLSAALHYAQKHKKTCVIAFSESKHAKNKACDKNYIEICFVGFPLLDEFVFPNKKDVTIWTEPTESSHCFVDVPYFATHVLLRGSFQAIEYIPHDFRLWFSFPLPKLQHASFLHVKRKKFETNAWYIQDCIRRLQTSEFGTLPPVCVASDDTAWCQTNPMFQNLQCDKQSKNELETMSWMMHCDQVAVCSDSCFAFWAAYFSSCHKILLPETPMKKSKKPSPAIPNRTELVDSCVWPFYVFLTSSDQEVLVDSLTDHAHLIRAQNLNMAMQTFVMATHESFAVIVLQSCQAQTRGLDDLKWVLNHNIAFDCLVLGQKENTTTKTTKAVENHYHKVTLTTKPLAIFLSRQMAAKWLKNPDWNSYTNILALNHPLFA